ncbi:MAG: cyclase family protein [Succinivibrio sp.]|nr:cyclase family protein [Succinivibrio sp.]
MKIDLSYHLDADTIKKLAAKISDRDKALSSAGHFGTHFDVMGKQFSLDYTESRGVIFDVRGAGTGEIGLNLVDLSLVQEGDFVLLYTAVSEKYAYQSDEYNTLFPQLSWELIEALTDKHIHVIGIDMRGVRQGAEHGKADNFCAERGVFIVENLVNLGQLLRYQGQNFIVHLYPLPLEGFSGLPSRVVAEIAG